MMNQSSTDSTQSQILGLVDQISALRGMYTALEAKNKLMEQVNVQLYSTVMSQAEQQARLKLQFDQRTQEYLSTTEFLRNSIDILSAKIQELTRSGASDTAYQAIRSGNQAASHNNGPSFQPSFGVQSEDDDDDTGAILQTSLQEFINNLTFQGDMSLKQIRRRLLRITVTKEVLQSWNPRDRSETVKNTKKEVIAAILSTRYIHKFKSHQLAYTVTKSSVWHGIVNDLYRRKSAAERKKLVKYFATASKPRPGGSATFFSTFIETVILLHRDHCKSCPRQPS